MGSKSTPNSQSNTEEQHSGITKISEFNTDIYNR